MIARADAMKGSCLCGQFVNRPYTVRPGSLVQRELSAKLTEGLFQPGVVNPSVTASPGRLPEGELPEGQEKPAWAVTRGRLFGMTGGRAFVESTGFPGSNGFLYAAMQPGVFTLFT